MTPEDFAASFDRFKESAFRLETLQRYTVRSDLRVLEDPALTPMREQAWLTVAQEVGTIVEIFEIRFVENGNDVFRDALEESIDLLLAGQRASGIVWVRDEDEARLRRDGRNHGVKVMPQIGAWDFDRARAENRRD